LAPDFIATGRLYQEMMMRMRNYKKKSIPVKKCSEFYCSLRIPKNRTKIAMVVLVWWDFVWRLDCQYDGGKIPDLCRSSYYGVTTQQ
jgi:hypothetical protein